MTQSPDYYEGVRAAIAALPDANFTVVAGSAGASWQAGVVSARLNIESLLPRPDPAKKLVDRFAHIEDGFDYDPKLLCKSFALSLMAAGIIDPEKVK